MKDVMIYSTGVLLNKTGISIAMLQCEGRKKFLKGGFERNTDTNREELKGIIRALKALKSNKVNVVIRTRSDYLIDGFQYAQAWGSNKELKNHELWKELYKMKREIPSMRVAKINIRSKLVEGMTAKGTELIREYKEVIA